MSMTPQPRVEEIPPDRFRPSHCPRPECRDHLISDRTYRPIGHGNYRRKCDGRTVPRFKCRSCRRTFSQQTFATSYYLKRPELLDEIAKLIVSGCALRPIARFFECPHSTVAGQCRRLGRHAVEFHELSLVNIDELEEPVVLDTFETFVRAQVEPVGVATVVGAGSWFVYAIDGVRYKGSGRRSRRKPPLKRKIERPAPGRIVRSTRTALERVLSLTSGSLRLISDDHFAYPPAIRQLRDGGAEIEHTVHRNPTRGNGDPDGKARARDMAMFPVDLLHKLIRHLQKHHSRETMAFARKRVDLVGRLSIFIVWRNFIKKRTERRPCKESPATRLGLAERLWKWNDVLAERLFGRRVALGC